MGFIDSVFGGKDKQKFAAAPESASAIAARKRLEELSTGAFPTIPLQGIADLPEATEETKLARGTAADLLKPTEQQDIFSLPEVQGLILKAREEGNILANRLGRGLQSTGAATSTTGRDVLGRAVSDVESRIAGTLAPFAESQRNRAFQDVVRRQNLIPLLSQMGLTQESREQTVEQAKLDAIFRKASTEAGQTQNFLIPLLEFLITSQPAQIPFVQEAGPGLLEQISAIAQTADTVISTVSGLGALKSGSNTGQTTIPSQTRTGGSLTSSSIGNTRNF
jgi:hypothetical protein